ncbi:glycoside hydrolase family 28 protein [Penicillium mononematosum]|uniref:glycoside hydrolase family 28 protein n=1 Tax=Penicillium mononematosum TaxID=268346 RepID=UPI002549B81F|nr:glycoside hydrolase family 28 protein [Penicillium mononematosum]KAJ6187596.1 glycoside hydrolase family 28 protein [Penicillium mononematosum]
MKLPLIFAATCLLGLGGAEDTNGQTIVTYPIPSGITQRTTFKTTVSPSGQDKWKSVEAYQATVAEVNITTGSFIYHDTSVAYFDFSAPVDVSVEYMGTDPIKSVQIRPYSYGIKPFTRDKKILFTLPEPRNLVIQVNNDIFDCLHLFSNTIDPNPPSADDPNVIYFGPGVHNVTGGTTNVASGKRVYVAGGAVVTSTFAFQNVSNASISGRGVVNHSKAGALLVESSKNITVEDIIFLNPNGYTLTAGEADGLTVKNIRSFSSIGWGDGLDFFCSKNVVVDGVFMRNSDDCVALYQHRWNYYGNSSNITIQNAALWADVAHPINIGTHGNSESPETMDGITIRNVDILRQHEAQQLYQGSLAINVGDENLVKNVLIDGFRVEDIAIGQLINMRVMYNTKYNTAPGRGIRNVTIKNMSYNGTSAGTSIFSGYDESRAISFINFQNLIVNHTRIADNMYKPGWYLTTDYIPAFANSFVSNMTFT